MLHYKSLKIGIQNRNADTILYSSEGLQHRLIPECGQPTTGQTPMRLTEACLQSGPAASLQSDPTEGVPDPPKRLRGHADAGSASKGRLRNSLEQQGRGCLGRSVGSPGGFLSHRTCPCLIHIALPLGFHSRKSMDAENLPELLAYGGSAIRSQQAWCQRAGDAGAQGSLRAGAVQAPESRGPRRLVGWPGGSTSAGAGEEGPLHPIGRARDCHYCQLGGDAVLGLASRCARE